MVERLSKLAFGGLQPVEHAVAGWKQTLGQLPAHEVRSKLSHLFIG